MTVLSPPKGSLTDFFRRRTFGIPFSSDRCETVDRIANAILHDKKLRTNGAAVSLAFWLRKSALSDLKRGFELQHVKTSSYIVAPVGRVFHITPANVDTVFVYSWALSYLTGNMNLVRLPQERSDVMDRLLFIIRSNIGKHAPENFFVTNSHNDEITAVCSKWCTHRVVWGGDETVGRLRSIPLPSYASERVFGTKFSYAVIRTAKYVSSSEQEKKTLAARFYNDLFWFDQMACSSPHVVFWLGGAPPLDQFDDMLSRIVTEKQYIAGASQSMKRLSFAFDQMSRYEGAAHITQPGFVSVRLTSPNDVTRDVCGGGLIRHVRVGNMKDVINFSRPQDQTVTHFGLYPDEIAKFASGSEGIDRIVPIGEALAFGAVWDGYDLLGDFIRRIVVK
jgi:hypothetical protein